MTCRWRSACARTRGDHLGMRVPDVGDAHAGEEIEVLATLGVAHDRPARVAHDEAHRVRPTSGRRVAGRARADPRSRELDLQLWPGREREQRAQRRELSARPRERRDAASVPARRRATRRAGGARRRRAAAPTSPTHSIRPAGSASSSDATGEGPTPCAGPDSTAAASWRRRPAPFREGREGRSRRPTRPRASAVRWAARSAASSGPGGSSSPTVVERRGELRGEPPCTSPSTYTATGDRQPRWSCSATSRATACGRRRRPGSRRGRRLRRWCARRARRPGRRDAARARRRWRRVRWRRRRRRGASSARSVSTSPPVQYVVTTVAASSASSAASARRNAGAETPIGAARLHQRPRRRRGSRARSAAPRGPGTFDASTCATSHGRTGRSDPSSRSTSVEHRVGVERAGHDVERGGRRREARASPRAGSSVAAAQDRVASGAAAASERRRHLASRAPCGRGGRQPSRLDRDAPARRERSRHEVSEQQAAAARWRARHAADHLDAVVADGAAEVLGEHHRDRAGVGEIVVAEQPDGAGVRRGARVSGSSTRVRSHGGADEPARRRGCGRRSGRAARCRSAASRARSCRTR